MERVPEHAAPGAVGRTRGTTNSRWGGAPGDGNRRGMEPADIWKEGETDMLTRVDKFTGAALAAILVGGMAMVAGSGIALAEEDLIGADEYEYSCLACHGVGGRGNGPMAEFLSVAPSDLTLLTQENDGVFPLLEIFHVIDGRTVVGPHGGRETEGWEMPVWGARYRAEQDGKYGPYGGEQAVRARVLELVFYIQSIQQ